jgi:kynurenine 3-monooxygenase
MIQIIGAGPIGLTAGIIAAQKKLRFAIYEERSEASWKYHDPTRQIGMTLSDRGLFVLEQLGLKDHLRKYLLPIYGRSIHLADGRLLHTNYSKNNSVMIHSISRNHLMEILSSHLENICPHSIKFNHSVAAVCLETNIASFNIPEQAHLAEFSFSELLGCDGARSKIKSILESQNLIKTESRPTEWEFASLSIQSHFSEKNPLERILVLPRESYFAVGIPHLDGIVSFTIGFNCQATENEKFEILKKAISEISNIETWGCGDLTEKASPEELALLIQQAQKFKTVLSTDITKQEQIKLLGDARHHIIHLMGQGLNLGLEELHETFKDSNSRILSKKILDSNSAMLSIISEKQINFFRKTIASNYSITLNNIRTILSTKFPAYYLNDYKELVKGRTDLNKVFARIRIQRIFEFFLGINFFAFICSLFITSKKIEFSNYKKTGKELRRA